MYCVSWQVQQATLTPMRKSKRQGSCESNDTEVSIILPRKCIFCNADKYLKGSRTRCLRVEENQKRRMQSTDAVTIKLMEDAFGANTQRIRNRKKVVPIIDKIVERSKVCEDETFAASIASLEERANMIEQDHSSIQAFKHSKSF